MSTSAEKRHLLTLGYILSHLLLDVTVKTNDLNAVFAKNVPDNKAESEFLKTIKTSDGKFIHRFRSAFQDMTSHIEDKIKSDNSLQSDILLSRKQLALILESYIKDNNINPAFQRLQSLSALMNNESFIAVVNRDLNEENSYSNFRRFP